MSPCCFNATTLNEQLIQNATKGYEKILGDQLRKDPTLLIIDARFARTNVIERKAAYPAVCTKKNFTFILGNYSLLVSGGIYKQFTDEERQKRSLSTCCFTCAKSLSIFGLPACFYHWKSLCWNLFKVWKSHLFSPNIYFVLLSTCELSYTQCNKFTINIVIKL